MYIQYMYLIEPSSKTLFRLEHIGTERLPTDPILLGIVNTTPTTRPKYHQIPKEIRVKPS